MLFDSHTHLNEDSFSEDEVKSLIEGINKSDILSFVADIGFDLESSRTAARHAAQNDWCVAAVGVHPHDSEFMNESIYEEIKALAGQEKVRAIGEIGLDYHYMRSCKEKQRYWFRRQIQLANELKMPIVVHSREADQETMDILVEEGAFSDERKKMFPPRSKSGGGETFDCRVDIHCFSGSSELAQQYVKLGATIGICGPVTFKNNKKTVKVVENIPLEYLMVETDAPFLTPVPHRGKPNKPWFVEHIAAKVAEIKSVGFEVAAKLTCTNAMRFYGIKNETK